MESPGDGDGDGERRAVAALQASGIGHTITRHGPLRSLEEAAAVRGVHARDIVKTLVVRQDEGHFVFVLVPGDRQLSWPKLRAVLGANRLSLPDADIAQAVTGYERGTITPFGSTEAWPVVADASVVGRTVSLGAGAPGVAVTVSGDDVVRALEATVADIVSDVSG